MQFRAKEEVICTLDLLKQIFLLSLMYKVLIIHYLYLYSVLISNSLAIGDADYYKLNEDKLLNWIKSKVNQICAYLLETKDNSLLEVHSGRAQTYKTTEAKPFEPSESNSKLF